MSECPAHGTPLEYMGNQPPDSDWYAASLAMKEKLAARAEASADRIISVTGDLLRQDTDGRFWVSSYELIRAGIWHRLQADDVLEINPHPVPEDHPGDSLWEVQAYSDRRRAYWVRPLRVPAYPPSDVRDSEREG